MVGRKTHPHFRATNVFPGTAATRITALLTQHEFTIVDTCCMTQSEQNRILEAHILLIDLLFKIHRNDFRGLCININITYWHEEEGNYTCKASTSWILLHHRGNMYVCCDTFGWHVNISCFISPLSWLVSQRRRRRITNHVDHVKLYFLPSNIARKSS